MKILLIEDDISVVNYVKQGLEDLHHTVDAALDGVAGLNLAFGNEYDIILLDLLLPGMNGIDIFKMIKNHVNALIIFTTSNDHLSDKLKSRIAEADGYISKPYSINDLRKKIELLRTEKIQIIR
jgi:two-component system, OmpR family, copper resistance phosphate regulon response regulator CusR